MLYATAADFDAHYGTALTEGLAGVERARVMARAASRVDAVIGRRSLGPKRAVAERFPVGSGRPDRRVLRLPDWPPCRPDLWSQTLVSLELFAPDFSSMGAVTVGDVDVWPAERGLLYLPAAADDRWHAVGTWTCGYATFGTPLTPTGWATTAGVTTVTAAAHGLTAGDVVVAHGTTPAGYAGTYEVVATTSGSFTVAAPANLPDSTAHGTVTPAWLQPPHDLQLATLRVAEALVRGELMQHADDAYIVGVQKAVAAELLNPYRQRVIA